MTRGEAPVVWRIRGGALPLDRPLLMGILNLTPDSFSDGGRFQTPEHALRRAEEMIEEGADLLDLGGESTRPGAAGIAEAEEIARVVPVLRALRARFDLPLSVDTRKASVARAAIDEGADVVNDVSALGDPEMASVVAAAGVGVVLMHMRGTPETMQADPRYDDVAGEVTAELSAALERALGAGIEAERVVVDPGIGFAKTGEHNVELIAKLDRLLELGRPILLGPSRKAFLGALLGGAPAEERAVATAAACVMGRLRGAALFRVHDVRPVREALVVADAIHRQRSRGS